MRFSFGYVCALNMGLVASNPVHKKKLDEEWGSTFDVWNTHYIGLDGIAPTGRCVSIYATLVQFPGY